MSAVGKAVYAILAADAGVTALLGAASAIYPAPAPADVAVPYIAWQLITTRRDGDFDGAGGLAVARVQVEAWGVGAAAVAAVADALRAALQDYAGTAGGVVVASVELDDEAEDYDDGSGLRRARLDFLMTYRES